MIITLINVDIGFNIVLFGLASVMYKHIKIPAIMTINNSDIPK